MWPIDQLYIELGLYHSNEIAKARPHSEEWQTDTFVQKQWSMRNVMHSKEFFGKNQGKRRKFDPSILPYKFGLMFMKKKKKSFFFEQNKNQNDRLKKNEIFKIANSQNFLVKISQIGPWVSRID